MKKSRQLKIALAACVILTAFGVMTIPLSAAEISKIDKDGLKAMLDNPDVVILDVRTGNDWSASEFKIRGANRANPREFNNWADKYPKDKKLVFYCA